MTKTPKAYLTEAKRIAARMLAMPPEPHKPIGKAKLSPAKRTSGKGRVRVGKAKH